MTLRPRRRSRQSPEGTGPAGALRERRPVMLVANFGFLAIGLAGAKLFSLITLVPRTFLWPSVFVLSTVGAYAYRQTMFDRTGHERAGRGRQARYWRHSA